MRKKVTAVIVMLLMVVFLISAAVTMAFGRPPLCNRCIKEGCAGTHCYVNCVDCCFWWNGILYCER